MPTVGLPRWGWWMRADVTHGTSCAAACPFHAHGGPCTSRTRSRAMKPCVGCWSGEGMVSGLAQAQSPYARRSTAAHRGLTLPLVPACAGRLVLQAWWSCWGCTRGCRRAPTRWGRGAGRGGEQRPPGPGRWGRSALDTGRTCTGCVGRATYVTEYQGRFGAWEAGSTVRTQGGGCGLILHV